MASTWESVLIRKGIVDFCQIAESASMLLSDIMNPIEIWIHFLSAVDDQTLVSCEITSFRKKPALLRRGAVARIEEEVFGDSGLYFENVEGICLAGGIRKRLGRWLVATLSVRGQS